MVRRDDPPPPAPSWGCIPRKEGEEGFAASTRPTTFIGSRPKTRVVKLTVLHTVGHRGLRGFYGTRGPRSPTAYQRQYRRPKKDVTLFRWDHNLLLQKVGSNLQALEAERLEVLELVQPPR